MKRKMFAELYSILFEKEVRRGDRFAVLREVLTALDKGVPFTGIPNEASLASGRKRVQSDDSFERVFSRLEKKLARGLLGYHELQVLIENLKNDEWLDAQLPSSGKRLLQPLIPRLVELLDNNNEMAEKLEAFIRENE